MKVIFNYRIYLGISLLSILVGFVSSAIHIDGNAEPCALIAFIFFTIAVLMVAFEEFFIQRPLVRKKIKSIFAIWKK